MPRCRHFDRTHRCTATVSDPVRLLLGNGIELHYVARGCGEPLVLLHGGMGDLGSWAPQLDSLSRSHRVIAYSRRYSYPNRNAPGPADHSALTEAEDLARLLRALRLESAHFVGTSYGAFAALVFAIAHPRMVRSLVLAEPPLHQWARNSPAGETLYREFISTVWSPAAQAFGAGSATDAMRILFDGIGGRRLFDRLAPNLGAEIMRNACSMEALVRSSNPFPDLARSMVQNLDVPAMLLRGEHAIELHKRVNDELARALPNAQQFVIPRAGHSSPRENPVAFNALVSRFLAARRSR